MECHSLTSSITWTPVVGVPPPLTGVHLSQGAKAPWDSGVATPRDRVRFKFSQNTIYSILGPQACTPMRANPALRI